MALCCAAVALLGAGAVYWDLQDGYFSKQLVFLPIFTGLLALALLLFPGGPGTFRALARDPGTGQAARWLAGIPPRHRRAWLLAAGLSFYLSFMASNYLEGNVFFSLREQVVVLLALLVVGLVLRKQLRQLW